MRRNTVEIVVGRLLEVRLDAGCESPEDVEVIFRSIRAAIARLPPDSRPVSIVDYRNCERLEPEAASRLGACMNRLGDRTVRGATLAPSPAPSQAYEFRRSLLPSERPPSSRPPKQKMFFNEGAAVRWLEEVLSPPERHRLRVFLGLALD